MPPTSTSTNSTGSQIRPRARVFHPYQTEQRHPHTLSPAFHPATHQKPKRKDFKSVPTLTNFQPETPIRVLDSVTLAQLLKRTYIIHPSTPNSIRRRRIIYIPIPSQIPTISSFCIKKKSKTIRSFGNPSQVSVTKTYPFIFTTHNSTANKPHAGFHYSFIFGFFILHLHPSLCKQILFASPCYSPPFSQASFASLRFGSSRANGFYVSVPIVVSFKYAQRNLAASPALFIAVS